MATAVVVTLGAFRSKRGIMLKLYFFLNSSKHVLKINYYFVI